MQYAHEFILNLVLGDPTTWVYQLRFDEHDSNDTNNIQYLLVMDWDYG